MPPRADRPHFTILLRRALFGLVFAMVSLPAGAGVGADPVAGPVASILPASIESGSIGGRVTATGTSAPVAGLIVGLRPEGPGAGDSSAEAQPRIAVTDAGGWYVFQGLLPGTYHLLFGGQRSGGRAAGGLRVVAGVETRIDASVASPRPAGIETVTVRADLRGIETVGPSEFQVAGRSLSERPASLQDPFRAIAGSAGIVAQNDFKSDLWVRGGEAAETEVLLDGLPLPQPYHFSGSGGSAALIGGDLVEELDVRTGGFSVEYGDALAGVVDIVTRDARPDRLTGQVSASTILGQATLRGPAGDGQWALSGRRGSLGLYDGRVEEDGIGAVAFHDVLGRFNLPILGSGRLEISALETGDDFSQDLGAGDRAALAGGQRAIRAEYEAALDGRTFLRLLVSEGKLTARGSVTGSASYDQDQERQDLIASVLRQAGESHRLNLGLSLSLARGAIDGQVDEGYAVVPNSVRGATRTEGIFVEDQWHPTGRLSLRYGLRADRFSLTGQSSVSPRAAFEFRVEPSLTLRAAVGRFVQFPRQEQIFLAVGEPLGRQVADHFIVGVERLLGGSARLTIEGYVKEMKDVAGEALNRWIDLPELMTRFDRGRARGVDATLERTGNGPWRLRLDYSYTVALQEREGTVYPRNTDQRHTASGLFGRRFLRGWEISGMVKYGSGLPYTPQIPWSNGIDSGVALGVLNGARLPAYYRLDLRLARAVPTEWGRLSAYLDLINVTDHRNVRSLDLAYDPQRGAYWESARYQSPFLPVFGLTADF